MPEPIRHYSVKELANYWQCSYTHVRNLINSGQLRYLMYWGKIIIPRIYIEEFEVLNTSDKNNNKEIADTIKRRKKFEQNKYIKAIMKGDWPYGRSN